MKRRTTSQPRHARLLMSRAQAILLLRSSPLGSSVKPLLLKRRRSPIMAAASWSASSARQPSREMNSLLGSERTTNMNDALSPAVFVDRDGTIMKDYDYCSDPKEVKILPGVPQALARLKSKGFKLIIITNQSGIGCGLITTEQYRAVEKDVLQQLGAGLIDATYFCPDVPGQHSICRK